jgi:hypothetical protein
LLPLPPSSPSSSCFRRVSHSSFPFFLFLFYLISLFLPFPPLVFIHPVPPPPPLLILFFLPPSSSSCFYSYISFAKPSFLFFAFTVLVLYPAIYSAT